MKRLLAFTMLVMLMLSLFGCTNNTTPPTEQPQISQQAQVIETTAETVAETTTETIAETTVITTADDIISEDEAKTIALNHAQLKETNVTRLSVELDFDDGILRYEIDFTHNGYEYDYDIDAKTGTILSYDKDFDD